jgi:hypothetical protein
MTFRGVRLFAERARAHASARLVRSQKRAQWAVKHVERLVQNFFPQGPRLRARAAESGSNRPNRLGVIRARHRTRDGGRGTKSRRRRSTSGKISQRFVPALSVRLRSSEAELGLEQIVHRFRIGLAAGRLHHLTDEPTRERRLCLHLLHLVRVVREDLVDHSFDR